MNKFIFFLITNVCCFAFSTAALLGVYYLVPLLFNLYLGVVFAIFILFFSLAYYFYNLFFYSQRNLKLGFINGFFLTVIYIFVYTFGLILLSIEKFFVGRIPCEDSRLLKYCSPPTWFEDYAGIILIIVLFVVVVNIAFISIFYLTRRYGRVYNKSGFAK